MCIVVTMSSSPPPRNPPPSPSSLAFFKRQGIAIERQRILSQLDNTTTLGRASLKSADVPTIAQGLAAIQLGPTSLLSPLGCRDAAADEDHGPGDASDAKSVSSGRSSKVGFRKRMSKLFKGDPKSKNAVPTSAASSAPI